MKHQKLCKLLPQQIKHGKLGRQLQLVIACQALLIDNQNYMLQAKTLITVGFEPCPFGQVPKTSASEHSAMLSDTNSGKRPMTIA